MRASNFLLLCLTFLAGCAPQVPIFQSNPANPELVTVAESPDVTIQLEHIGKQFNHLVFLVKLTNHSLDSVWFNPQHTSYYASGKMFKTPLQASDIHSLSYANSRLASKRIFASNADQILKLAENRAANMRVLAGVAVLVSAAVIVHDVVQDQKDYMKETWSAKDENRAFARDAVVSSTLLLADASLQAKDNARDEEYYLEEEVLPALHVPPGGTVQGKIYLMNETSFRYTRLVIPFRNVEYVFDFKRRNAPGKFKNED